MKNHSKKMVWRSLVSIFIFMVFLFLGLGSNSFYDIINIPLMSSTKYDSKTNTYNEFTQGLSGQSLDTFYQHQVLGPKDLYGNWEGEVQIFTVNHWRNENNELLETAKFEKVQFENGKRNGQSITKYYGFTPDRANDTVCYDYGIRIPCGNFKSALVKEEENSGFNILQQNYPWFLGTLNVLGFTNDSVQSYMDTIEVILNTESFEFSKFDSQYDDVIEQLNETPYDSLVQISGMVTSLYGRELMKDLDFRMAVIDQQRYKNITTFQLLQSKYPYFLTSFNSEEVVVKDSEWDAFCSKFDSLMNTFSPLDIYDPFFVDSVDTRTFGVLMAIYEEGSDTTKSALKHAVLNKQNLCLSCLLKEHDKPLLRQQASDIPPENFAFAIMIRMYRIFLYDGDVIRLAVKEAYSNQKSIATLASVTTHLNGKISENNFELLGNVVKDGGAEITERGLVWAKYNNPTVDDNKIIAGEGIGAFTSLLQTTDDSTYYVRAFATNSVGTNYGNSIIINSNTLVGLDNFESDNFEFKIYPNPTSGEITIDGLNGSLETEIIVSDNSGKRILYKTISASTTKINISGNASGIYHVTVRRNKQQTNYKIIKR